MDSSLTSNLFDQLSHGYRVDQHLGAVYDFTPSGADDLTKIRGVDTREAVILNRLGVYFIPQVALWTHRESAAFADELGMSVSTLVDEQWVQQAQGLSHPRPVGPSRNAAHLPASAIRTVSLLAFALFAGCLFVYWLSLRSNHPLTGVLSADITTLRVPTDSRLIETHVLAGDEVYSGDKLLTLEKTEHLSMIDSQERRVNELARQLRQATAKSELDLEWRTRDLEREISDVRTRARLFQEVKSPRPLTDPVRSASLHDRPLAYQPFGMVSQSKMVATRVAVANSMVFVSGHSGESSIDEPRPESVPLPRTVLASEPAVEDVFSAESRDMESRLSRLEELRTVLPEQVRRAAGVESVRVQFEEASQRLAEFKALSRNVSVLCPAYGKVGQVRYKQGDTMSPGETMLKILHTDRRYILAHVPTRRVNEVEPGMMVSLSFPGNHLYRGKVSNLPMLAEANAANGQSLASVRIEPVGKLWPEIPIGSQIEVVIAKDRAF